MLGDAHAVRLSTSAGTRVRRIRGTVPPTDSGSQHVIITKRGIGTYEPRWVYRVTLANAANEAIRLIAACKAGFDLVYVALMLPDALACTRSADPVVTAAAA